MLPPTYVEGFHDLEAVKAMRYSSLGSTGLLVSHLSLGGGALGGFYGEFEEAEAIEAIREALRKGVNYIDTAPWYGDGKSEAILGKALAGVPRKAYYIATKVGRYKPITQKMFDFSSKKTLASVEESLKLLGLPYVDIIQVHDLEFAPSLQVVLSDTLPALASVVKQGKAHHIGITGYPICTLKELLEMNAKLQSPTKIEMVLCYTRATFFDCTLQEYLPFFQSKNIGVVNAALTGMGILTNAGPPDWHPAGDEIKEVCRKAAEHCKMAGVELGRLAVYYALNEVQGPATHLVGLNNKEILMSNLSLAIGSKAGEGSKPFTPAEEKALTEVRKKFFEGLQSHHWEGIEISRYWKAMNNL
ncbi:L-galactose dehydrogenase-like [Ischnura elegans]|uniref:L-galactose dehydrogenase-like n=1 Tax=Ischnura elegans TaxID=197161 RepID=UPI001ED8B63B|nr:L-galactose dehydrogenase-like [Ischnura elegans]